MTDHFFNVPLDYSDESKGTINLFVRVAMKQAHPESARLPCLLFLQGEHCQPLTGTPKGLRRLLNSSMPCMMLATPCSGNKQGPL